MLSYNSSDTPHSSHNQNRGAIAKSRQKACNACTKAKRRCSLQHPSCQRCIIRGVKCYYPSTRLHDTVPGTSSASPNICASRDSSIASHSQTRHTEAHMLVSRLSPEHLYDISEASSDKSALQFLSANTAAAVTTHSLLYSDELLLTQGDGTTAYNPVLLSLLPGSWSVASSAIAPPNRLPRTIPQLNQSVNQVQRWVRQWVEEGSNMFIHKNLYYSDSDSGDETNGLHMPQCIQDAYTTCAAYFACTTKNRMLTLRIIEQRVENLLREQQEHEFMIQGDKKETVLPAYFFSEDPVNANDTSEIKSSHTNIKVASSVLDHLARVQALLVYQLIRLYDGDEHSRIMAESVMPVLTRWRMQMLDSALLSSHYVYSMNTLVSNRRRQYPANLTKKFDSDWRSWILAESVRRTWLVAGHMQCIYSLLSYGINACPGGLMFTPRAGLWHAESAYEWWTRCKEMSSGGESSDALLFCQSLESGSKLLGKTSPHEVDDFGRFVLHIIAGEEKMNEWLSVC